MMQPDERKQRLVKMTLRIVVAAYIGFMGVMLVKGYLGDPNIAFMIFGILFLVLAVGFVVYALVSFFRTPADALLSAMVLAVMSLISVSSSKYFTIIPSASVAMPFPHAFSIRR